MSLKIDKKEAVELIDLMKTNVGNSINTIEIIELHNGEEIVYLSELGNKHNFFMFLTNSRYDGIPRNSKLRLKLNKDKDFVEIYC